MDKESKIIRVFSGTELEVNLLKDEFDQIGISSLIQNEYNSGIVAGFFAGGPSAVDLFIQESDLSEAEPIIKEFNHRYKL
ncbi:MAG: DUF2007 domain-containing protein [Bacteroidales bacterium]|nr:DUF2007 domain-containing protein [Bacteroidales bacterium]MCF8456348.1 DUF2007 domain-containing protein [Bacteroidales bacterium]